MSVTVLATQSVIFGLAALENPRPRPREAVAAHTCRPGTHVLALILGVALLALTPRLWQGTRTAVALTIVGLLALATLSATHGRYVDATVQACLALMLALGRGAFRLGCSNRPRPAIACAAAVAWGLAFCAVLLSPLVEHAAGHVIARVLHNPVGHAAHLGAAGSADPWSGHWAALTQVLIGAAAAISVLALRSLVSPARRNHHFEHEHRAARAIVDAHGGDSLSPFLVRPDKALAFAAGGVLSYRVIGGTAVVSADPVGPRGAEAKVLASFQDQARRRGWQVVLWGAGSRHLDSYSELGFRSICVGEEAFVDPAKFSLEGRPVRKLRQSVHRVQRHGWQIAAQHGREIDAGLEAEIDALRTRWRQDHRRIHGFAMGMGIFDGELAGRRPVSAGSIASGRARRGNAVRRLRFSLSLDTMQRVGDTPNGLNEALVVHALKVARELGSAEVSLNYAGLAHLVRREPSRNRVVRTVTQLAMAPLHRRFQMDRLVRFNEKFSPDWRPRYLVYESRTALPRAIVRVLQAEGYLAERHRLDLPEASHHLLPWALPARPRPRGPISEPR